MEVNDELVKQLAELSRLEFSGEERASIQADLQRMIQFVEQLKAVDTAGVPPLLHITGGDNLLREDGIAPSLSVEEALKNAPEHDNRFFKVPKVIKK